MSNFKIDRLNADIDLLNEEMEEKDKQIAELEEQVKVLTFISHPVERNGYVHHVGYVAKTMIDECNKLREQAKKLKGGDV